MVEGFEGYRNPVLLLLEQEHVEHWSHGGIQEHSGINLSVDTVDADIRPIFYGNCDPNVNGNADNSPESSLSDSSQMEGSGEYATLETFSEAVEQPIVADTSNHDDLSHSENEIPSVNTTAVDTRPVFSENCAPSVNAHINSKESEGINDAKRRCSVSGQSLRTEADYAEMATVLAGF